MQLNKKKTINAIQKFQTPFLAVSDGPFKKYLYHNVPMLRSKFWPTFWCVESRAQTVIPNLWREKFLQDLKYRRELLTLKDGGEIALDWSEKNCKDDSPLILILPGLTGASQAEYIKCMVKAGNRIGARIVVLNNRGLGGVALKVHYRISFGPRRHIIDFFSYDFSDTSFVLCCSC